MKYLKQTKKTLIESFKELDTKIINIILFDLIFYLITFLSLIKFGKITQNKYIKLNLLPMDKIGQLPQEELTKVTSQLQGFIFTLIAGIILIVLIIFLSVVIFKGLIWLQTTKTKTKLSFFPKFALLNLIWILVCVLPIVILAFLLKRAIMAPIIVLIALAALHFINIIYILFTKENKLNTIKKALKLGTKKLHHYIIPYLIIAIVFFLVFQVYWIYKFTPEKIQNIFSALILLTHLAWARIYLTKVTEELI
jgi:hypothetical protein